MLLNIVLIAFRKSQIYFAGQDRAQTGVAGQTRLGDI